MNDTLDQHIKEVLTETIRILFPINVDPNQLIKPHVWRDKKYVGQQNNKIVVWKGWSANLVAVDFRYRAVFVDVVENVLPVQERVHLFGEDFSAAIAGLSRFVVMFVLDFPLETIESIKEQGFVPRIMNRVLHACTIASVEEFVNLSVLHWTAKVARLVVLQRILSIHRKSLDSNEVPLQNLLYKTGYLHSYIVKHGLELHKLTRPRRSGEFGHDFHAIVKNPKAISLDSFPIGIELYIGSIGYHTDTIPQYITKFDLKGMIVIAKDNPLSNLSKIASKFNLLIFEAQKLSEIGEKTSIGIHHLPLEKVVFELSSIRDELETLIPEIRVHD